MTEFVAEALAVLCVLGIGLINELPVLLGIHNVKSVNIAGDAEAAVVSNLGLTVAGSTLLGGDDDNTV